MASRRKPYSLSALRNSVSFRMKARTMLSTSTGAPERLTTDEVGVVVVVAFGFCAAAEATQSRAARAAKRTLLINSLLNF
jgi:hypothetical protein